MNENEISHVFESAYFLYTSTPSCRRGVDIQIFLFRDSSPSSLAEGGNGCICFLAIEFSQNQMPIKSHLFLVPPSAREDGGRQMNMIFSLSLLSRQEGVRVYKKELD